jgi:single-strand DNA-binding protein
MNSVILIGRITAKPELAYTQNQKARCTFTLAVDRPSKNDERQADFIRIVAWDRQAENIGRYLYKGSKCAVSGRIQTGSYKDKDGKTVYTTDVIANHVEFLDSKSERQEEPKGEYEPLDLSDMPSTFSSATDDIPF